MTGHLLAGLQSSERQPACGWLAGWNLTFEPSTLLRLTLFLSVNVIGKVHHFKTGRIHDVMTTSNAP